MKTDVMGERITFQGGVKSLSIGGDLLELPGRGTSLTINGPVGSLRIAGSILGENSGQSNLKIGNFTIGSVSIGGDIVGGTVSISDAKQVS